MNKEGPGLAGALMPWSDASQDTGGSPDASPPYNSPGPSTCPYSTEYVEGESSEVRCANREDLAAPLGPGPWLRYLHRSKLLENA